MRIKLSRASWSVFVAAGLMLTSSTGCRTTANRLSHVPGFGWLAAEEEVTNGEGWAAYEPNSELPTPSETTQPTSPSSLAGGMPSGYASPTNSGTYSPYASTATTGASGAASSSYGTPSTYGTPGTYGSTASSTASGANTSGYGNSSPYSKSSPGGYFAPSSTQAGSKTVAGPASYQSPSYTANSGSSKFGTGAPLGAASSSGTTSGTYPSTSYPSYSATSTPTATASTAAATPYGSNMGTRGTAGSGSGYNTGSYYQTSGATSGIAPSAASNSPAGSAYAAPTSNYNSSTPSQYDANPYQPEGAQSYSTGSSNPYNNSNPYGNAKDTYDAGNPYGNLGPQANDAAISSGAGSAARLPSSPYPSPSFANDVKSAAGSTASRFEAAVGDSYSNVQQTVDQVANAVTETTQPAPAKADSIVNRYAESARNAYGNANSNLGGQVSQLTNDVKQYAGNASNAANNAVAPNGTYQGYATTGAQAYDSLADKTGSAYDQARTYAAGVAEQTQQAADSAATAMQQAAAGVREQQPAAANLSATANRFTQEVFGGTQQAAQRVGDAYSAGASTVSAQTNNPGPVTGNGGTSNYNPLPSNQWPEPSSTIKRSEAPWRPGSTGEYRGSSKTTLTDVQLTSYRPAAEPVKLGSGPVADEAALTLAVGDKYEFPRMIR